MIWGYRGAPKSWKNNSDQNAGEQDAHAQRESCKNLVNDRWSWILVVDDGMASAPLGSPTIAIPSGPLHMWWFLKS